MTNGRWRIRQPDAGFSLAKIAKSAKARGLNL
jgi:hypothetical protein